MLLIRLFLVCQCCMICHQNTYEHTWREIMALRLISNSKIDFNWYWYEILPRDYVIILWVFYYFILNHKMFFHRTMWYKIIRNYNSLRSLVLEISSFELDDYRGFCAGGGVHKIFVGGVCVILKSLFNSIENVLCNRDPYLAPCYSWFMSMILPMYQVYSLYYCL